MNQKDLGSTSSSAFYSVCDLGKALDPLKKGQILIKLTIMYQVLRTGLEASMLCTQYIVGQGGSLAPILESITSQSMSPRAP